MNFLFVLFYGPSYPSLQTQCITNLISVARTIFTFSTWYKPCTLVSVGRGAEWKKKKYIYIYVYTYIRSLRFDESTRVEPQTSTTNQAGVPENSRLERNNREPPLWLQEIADPLMDLKQGMETLRVNKTFRGILSTLLSIGIFLNGNEVGIECQPNDIRLIRQSESLVRAESIPIKCR